MNHLEVYWPIDGSTFFVLILAWLILPKLRQLFQNKRFGLLQTNFLICSYMVQKKYLFKITIPEKRRKRKMRLMQKANRSIIEKQQFILYCG